MAEPTTKNSQTASDYIDAQLQLEADARETLPYQFDTCTQPLGPLRQTVFACLTCTPPPASSLQQFSPAGVCYSCSISCHGDHELVELFCKRDFVCDCGTTRYSNSQTPCALRLNTTTSRKGGVIGDVPRQGNKYNQNFAGTFCGCGELYDPEKEKGTMFQCLGLGSVDDGGCGEDWWHPECIMGLPRNLDGGTSEEKSTVANPASEDKTSEAEHKTIDINEAKPDVGNASGGEHPVPTGFPNEDDFDHFVCYKCTEAFPWIKRYAGAPGFLPAVSFADATLPEEATNTLRPSQALESRKRKAEDDETLSTAEPKKLKSEDPKAIEPAPATAIEGAVALHEMLPEALPGKISLFLKEDFRDHFCRCPDCFPRLAHHPQLLEEEEPYEPPLSESEDDEHRSLAGRSVNSGSLLDRGEAALSSMDRVRAIEGVMAYNHVRDKVKQFLAPFAESGEAVGAEAIRAYFAQLRGDEQVQ